MKPGRNLTCSSPATARQDLLSSVIARNLSLLSLRGAQRRSNHGGGLRAKPPMLLLEARRNPFLHGQIPDFKQYQMTKIPKGSPSWALEPSGGDKPRPYGGSHPDIPRTPHCHCEHLEGARQSHCFPAGIATSPAAPRNDEGKGQNDTRVNS